MTSLSKKYSISRAHLDAAAPAAPLSVSSLVALIKKGVEQEYHNIRVVGEISSFKQWRSGHCYFDVKDENTLIPAVMFKPHFAQMQFAVADGQQVLITGRISVYAAQTRLQLIAEKMEPLGQGALALAFEQLKVKLKTAGLFDAEHKKKIKEVNEVIGLVTSSHGAVLRDMVRIIRSRSPKANILFMNTRVQGVGAKDEIARAIHFLDATGQCDVIIVGRGGGSLEDLWAFNEDVVAQAIFLAQTPIISAVGHETDTSISDFVADIRAATPTHAAQLAAAPVQDLLDNLGVTQKRLQDIIGSALKNHSLQLAQAKRRILDPRLTLFRHAQNLDECLKALNLKLAHRLKTSRQQLKMAQDSLANLAPHQTLRLKQKSLSEACARLQALSPHKKMASFKSHTAIITAALHEAMRMKITKARRDFEQGVVKLSALSPLAVLERGFSIIEDKDSGAILTRAARLTPGQKINLRMHDGAVMAQILTRSNE